VDTTTFTRQHRRAATEQALLAALSAQIAPQDPGVTEAEVRTLFLFHHDPDHDDAKVSQMLAHAREIVAARKGKLHVEAAREGVTVELPAPVPT